MRPVTELGLRPIASPSRSVRLAVAESVSRCDSCPSPTFGPLRHARMPLRFGRALRLLIASGLVAKNVKTVRLTGPRLSRRFPVSPLCRRRKWLKVGGPKPRRCSRGRCSQAPSAGGAGLFVLSPSSIVCCLRPPPSTLPAATPPPGDICSVPELSSRPRRHGNKALTESGYGKITTEIREAPDFYYAEDYHQQYLSKNPTGYCGSGGTGVTCPTGLRK
ncbi:mitochondrial peptide methionine sulfoxide reductase isoform X2 [Scleropages formosus]|uniref:mitochondrial peptide methionine sulfoxide reductase isoform X2 n=1 Tax=Scleropages formosus TaxID=113540 RepID=UPI0010FA8A98|nr:mitochondrial peptide methionine sulfoxide reductase isoform X2 [Scleropages formosus]